MRVLLAVAAVLAILSVTACNSNEETPPTTPSPSAGLISTIPGAGWHAVGVGFNPANHRLYVVWSQGPDHLRFAAIDPSTGSHIADTALPQGEFFNHIEVNPVTGKVYAIDALSNTLYILDSDTNELLVRTQGRRGTGQALAVDEETNLVYWTDGDITVIDGTTGDVVDTMSFEGSPHIFDVAINPTTRQLYATGSNDRVFVVDLATGSVTASIDVTGPQWIEVNRRTNRIYVSSHTEPEISVIDGASSSVIATLRFSGPFQEFFGPHIGVDSNTNRVYFPRGDRGEIDVLDGESNTIIQTISVGGQPLAIAVDEEAGRVYVTDFTFGADTGRVIVIGSPEAGALSATQLQPTSTISVAPVATPTPISTGTLNYTHPADGYSFQYPGSWELDTQEMILYSYDPASIPPGDAGKPVPQDKLKAFFWMAEGVDKPLAEWLAEGDRPRATHQAHGIIRIGDHSGR